VTLSASQADDLCRWVASGQTIRDWCRIPGHPGKSSVYNCIGADPDLIARITAARVSGSDAIAEETLAIADDGARDTIIGKDGEPRMDSEWVQRSKLRVDTRLRLLAKWNSGRYGDRTTLAGDPAAPLLAPPDRDTAAREIASILATAAARATPT
jgi:hypothetical protein